MIKGAGFLITRGQRDTQENRENKPSDARYNGLQYIYSWVQNYRC